MNEHNFLTEIRINGTIGMRLGAQQLASRLGLILEAGEMSVDCSARNGHQKP